ncbi:hypothetical protein G9464_12715 [Halostella sp. JP-L12]|uniref:hypothetical protein n=1 Tax=Halostella TaxID=1843185 RepID=UPI000EF75AB0|nr:MULTISPECIES: hypothetical protein [Halostella]NHN48448.1 hypothetical protein [Halostella sp. JP-L12]
MTSRRALLAGAAGLLAALAGCSTGDGGSGGDDSDGGDDTDATTEPGSGTDEASNGGSSDEEDDADGATSADPDDLDLREANVTGVAVASEGDGEYRFDVTLVHDDDGEDGYANWWQVETCGGQRLGRRDLAHAHGTEGFTRSTTVSVPDDVDRVVVRGHDQTHEYGGQAAVVAVENGETRFVRQGADPERNVC